MKWNCQRCKAINVQFSYQCHVCGYITSEVVTETRVELPRAHIEVRGHKTEIRCGCGNKISCTLTKGSSISSTKPTELRVEEDV